MFIVEQAIGHTFPDKAILKLALTSAGAEEDNHDGNRGLARIGNTVLQLVVDTSGYKNKGSRSEYICLEN